MDGLRRCAQGAVPDADHDVTGIHRRLACSSTGRLAARKDGEMTHPEDRHLQPWTKEKYNALQAHAMAKGLTVVSKWRPGIKRIRMGDIVLRGEGAKNDDPN